METEGRGFEEEEGDATVIPTVALTPIYSQHAPPRCS